MCLLVKISEVWEENRMSRSVYVFSRALKRLIGCVLHWAQYIIVQHNIFTLLNINQFPRSDIYYW